MLSRYLLSFKGFYLSNSRQICFHPLMDELEIAARAWREAGGAKKLAILLSSHGHQITPQAISQWKKIPAERAHLISELTGIARPSPGPLAAWGCRMSGFVYAIERGDVGGGKS
jgi:hypothetical protein